MENFNNEIFGFGAEDNNLEQTNNFNYNSISGLGESNYENEDLFSVEETNKQEEQTNDTVTEDNLFDNNFSFANDYRIGGFEKNTSDQIVVDNPFAMEQSQDILLNNTLDQTNNEVVNPIQPAVMTTIDSGEELVNPVENVIPFNDFIETQQTVETSQPDFVSVISNLKPLEPENIEQNIVEETQTDLNNTFVNTNSLINETAEITNTYPENFGETFVNQVEQPQTVVEEEIEKTEPSTINFYDTVTPAFDNSVEFSTDLESDDIVDNIEEYAVEPQTIEETIVAEETELDSTDTTTQEQTIEDSYTNEFNNQVSDIDDSEDESEGEEFVISETPIEELKKLAKYEDEYVEQTDINSLFDKVSVNVKDASEIFRKNSDMKAKIDTRFDELKKLQSEVESSKQKQLDEVNKYKEEVLGKLTEKKEEIEKRLNTLKEYQANLEKEKLEFEKYKKTEQANIEKVQKEVQAAYDDRREELNAIEDALRKQKDDLDAERSQLSLDRIQYEADKNELANNLLKFNELVNSFTNGVNAGRE